MTTGVPSIPLDILKSLWLPSSNGALTYASLEAAATKAGVPLGDFLWGLRAAQGGSDLTASIAKTVYSAVGSLPEAAELAELETAAAAAGEAAAAGAGAAEAGAVTAGAETATGGGIVSSILTTVGGWLGFTGTAAMVAGGLALTVVLGGITYGVSSYLGSQSGDEPVQPGPNMIGRTPGRSAGRDPIAAADPSAGRWCVWYVDNINLKPVLVTTKKDYLAPRLCNTYAGGGRPDGPSEPMQKILIVEDAPTRQAAAKAALEQFKGIRIAGSTLVHTEWLGERAGVVHDIDEIK